MADREDQAFVDAAAIQIAASQKAAITVASLMPRPPGSAIANPDDLSTLLLQIEESAFDAAERLAAERARRRGDGGLVLNKLEAEALRRALRTTHGFGSNLAVCMREAGGASVAAEVLLRKLTGETP